MNRKISTLLTAGLLVAGSLFGSAYAAEGDPVYLYGTTLKDGAYVYLSSQVTEKKDLAVKEGKSLVAHEAITTIGNDTTIAQIDTMAWQVKVVAGAAPTYQFVNRATGKLLSVKKGQAHKTAELSAGGIDTWAVDINGLTAVAGDSTYYLTYNGSNLVMKTVKYGDAITDALIIPRQIDTWINVSADVFNKSLSNMVFGALSEDRPNGEGDLPSKPEEDKILTANDWVALDIHYGGGKYFPDNRGNEPAKRDTLMFQLLTDSVSATGDSLGFLFVDTAYLEGTKNFKLGVNPGDSAFFRPTDARGTVTRKQGLDSLHLFTVHYNYGLDSIAIRPVALPVYLETGGYNGSHWYKTKSEGDSVIVHQKDTMAAVALKSIGNIGFLVVDTLGQDGVYAANLTTGRTTQAGDATIDTKKVYFAKYINSTDKDNNGKYLVADIEEEHVGAYEFDYAKEAYKTVPSTQWVVKASGAKGTYTLVNRANPDLQKSGAVITVDKDKAIYKINGDTLQLINAEAAAAAKEALVEDEDGNKFATTGYGYFDPEKLDNMKYKFGAASPLLAEYFAQANADSVVVLGEEEFYFHLEEEDAIAAYGVEVEGAYPGIDQLGRATYSLHAKIGKKDVKLVENEGKYVLSTVGTAVKFSLKNNNENANEYLMVVGIGTETAKIASINAQTGEIYPTAATAGKTDLFAITEAEAPSVLFTAPKHVSIFNNSDKLAIGKNNFAVVAQEGNALKSDVFEANNFVFWLDSVNYVADQTASYFVSQGIEGDDKYRLYMWDTTDSVNVESAAGEAKYVFADAPRLAFRAAFRNAAHHDSLTVKEEWNGTKLVADSLLEKTANSAAYQFTFVTIDDSEAYLIKSGKDKYVSNVNGFLVMTTEEDEAMEATLNAEEAPTANEAVAVAGVKVIAAEGAVIVKGAAGKNVTIANVLGQTVANVVATSDEVTIAAPAGVVVVAVEGEAAVKAIVK